MRKVMVLALVAMALFIVSSGSIFAADNSTTVTMTAMNGSGEDGTATITQKGDADVTVSVTLKNGTAEAQPAHIHKGSCANLNPTPAFPLTNVVNGKSEGDVMVSVAELNKGGYAINVHKSASDIATYVSCGDIKAGSMMMASGTGTTAGNDSMPSTGNGDQSLIFAALALVALGILGMGLKFSQRKA